MAIINGWRACKRNFRTWRQYMRLPHQETYQGAFWGSLCGVYSWVYLIPPNDRVVMTIEAGTTYNFCGGTMLVRDTPDRVC